MKQKLFSTMLLTGCAVLLVIGFANAAFWQGALAVFLLWWADNDRKQARVRERDQKLIAAHAPELVGKDFVQSAAYVLEAIEAHRQRADLVSRLKLAKTLAEQQAQWAAQGEPMPPWATLKLLRELESPPPSPARVGDA